MCSFEYHGYQVLRQACLTTQKKSSSDGSRDGVTIMYFKRRGKLRGHIRVPRGADKETILATVHSSPALQRHIEGKQIARVIVVPDELVNLVVKS